MTVEKHCGGLWFVNDNGDVICGVEADTPVAQTALQIYLLESELARQQEQLKRLMLKEK